MASISPGVSTLQASGQPSMLRLFMQELYPRCNICAGQEQEGLSKVETS